MTISNGTIAYRLTSFSICRGTAFYGAIMSMEADGTFWKYTHVTECAHFLIKNVGKEFIYALVSQLIGVRNHCNFKVLLSNP